MTAQLDQHVSGILLDVEGTTTPIDFVYKVLFPFALSHAAHFLQYHTSPLDVRADLEAMRQENLADARQGLAPPPFADADPGAEVESAVTYMEWLTARDRKSPAFKSLQGRIWEIGYRSGHLQAEVFPDVPSALARWQQQGQKICIFSSGSVLAQKLLFAHTIAGDLTPHIGSYFDTTTAGSKADPASYKKIADTCQLDPPEIVFISDIVAELDAAHTVGMKTLLSVRPGNRPQPVNPHTVIHSFDEIFS
ncbi:MAG TPA: acireductone synthase [Candidatus Angelobacter sp.]